MTNRIFIPEPIQPIKPHTGPKDARAKTEPSSFDRVLAEKTSGVRFSSHAQQRMKSRNIELGAQELQKLEQAVTKARDKGARESLILMNDLALVVSVKNNTVITAVDGENIKENVFTNIDSAVVV